MTLEKPDKPGNMTLWDSVCETDPAITKKVAQRGGFTAICAQAQLKRATELWGPYGSTWRVERLEWRILEHDGKPEELALEAFFIYPGGEFQLSVDMAYKPGNDSRKKLLTDLRSKALSLLGFNSDVFEGKFDDNKYVAEASAKAKETQVAKPQAPPENYTPPPLPASPPPAPDAPTLRVLLDKVAATTQFHMGDFLKHFAIPQPEALTPKQRAWLDANMHLGTDGCIRIMDEARAAKARKDLH